MRTYRRREESQQVLREVGATGMKTLGLRRRRLEREERRVVECVGGPGHDLVMLSEFGLSSD